MKTLKPGRSHTFRMWKSGQIVSARFVGSEFISAPKTWDRLPRDRIFAVDTESLSLKGKLSTLLVPLRFDNWGHLLETPDGLGVLEKFLDTIVQKYGVKYHNESRVKQRSPNARSERVRKARELAGKRPGKEGHTRDGRRGESIQPVLGVFFNLPYDFGRLSADRRDVLRAVNTGAGQDSYRIPVTPRLEIEVVRMHFGSGSSFEWFIRADAGDPKKRRIVRMIGLDLAAYWKTSLAEAARSVGVTEKIEIDPEWYSKPREAFTDAEWKKFRKYALGDARTTLELYHATVDLLVQIDPRVVRRTGVIPPSAPGAAARIVFAQAFDRAAFTDKNTKESFPAMPGCHPGTYEWQRYSVLADQMGLDAYYGGRSFNVERGVRSGLKVLDLKSAYIYALALLPDPVDVVPRPVISRREKVAGRDAAGKPVLYSALDAHFARDAALWHNAPPLVIDGSFDLDDWTGKFGVLYIDGESLDDIYPPFRIHSARKRDSGRLRYVAGRFENRAVTIPEIVIGVASGRLRVDRIRKGVVMEGAAENSFIRHGLLEFFRIKEDQTKPKPLRDMAKLLAVSLYGKLIELQTIDHGLGSAFPMARFAKASAVRASIAKINAENGPELEKLDGIFWGETRAQCDTARAYYDRANEKLEGGDDRGALAVIDYVTALRRAGVRREKKLDGSFDESPIAIADYVGKSHTCGFYFMPMYAANVTGLVSGMLGLMAHDVGALQGDTDSVHFDPEKIGGRPGLDGYYQTMREAGYPSPRKVGNRIVDGIPGAEQLGVWELQTPTPSVESILVRPKVYSHLFPDGTLKQAGHGFARFGATQQDLGIAFDHLAKALRNIQAGVMPEAKAAIRAFDRFQAAAGAGDLVSAREATPESRRMALHDAFRMLVTEGHVTYQGRAAPRKLREAMVSGREIGEFNSRVFEALLSEDPNTFRDPEGRTRWKQAVTAEHVPMAAPVRPSLGQKRRTA